MSAFGASFYRWRHAYQDNGEAGLTNAISVPHNHSNKTPPEVVEKVLHLRRKYHLGPIRIMWRDSPKFLDTLLGNFGSKENDMLGRIRDTEEFKKDAVYQVTDRGHSVADVSRRLDVSTKSMYDWIKLYSQPGRQRQEAAD